MTAIAADFSGARPGGAVLKAAGVTSVGRYLSYVGSQYGITDAEARDYKVHGIDIWLVREKGTSNMEGGYAQGVADAKESQSLLEALTEIRHDIPLYTACDEDVSGSVLDACAEYQRGWRDTLGQARSAAYGGGDFLYRVVKQDQTASLSWQSAGWAGEHSTVDVESGDDSRLRLDFVNIYQVYGNVMVPDTDKCLIFTDYYGQNSATNTPQGEDDMTAQDIIDIKAGITAIHTDTQQLIELPDSQRGFADQVDGQYTDVFGPNRHADPGGLALFVGLMTNSSWTIAQVRTALLSSDEYKRKLIGDLYVSLLSTPGVTPPDRIASPPEIESWLNWLHAGNDVTALTAALEASAEYKSKHPQ